MGIHDATVDKTQQIKTANPPETAKESRFQGDHDLSKQQIS